MILKIMKNVEKRMSLTTVMQSKMLELLQKVSCIDINVRGKKETLLV